MTLPLCLITAWFAVSPAFAQKRPAELIPWAEKNREKYGAVLVRDWKPQPSDVLPATPVPRARFAAIDVHTHVAFTGNAQRIADLVKEMDAANVRTVFGVTAGWEDELRRNMAELPGKYPGRFVLCTQVDVNAMDEPDFIPTALRRLEEAHRIGARCVKFRKDFASYLKGRDGRYRPVNDPRLDPVWKKCGELGMPVMLHVADPIGFFQPWDERNPTYRSLVKNPVFWFHGPDWEGVPRFTHEELMRQRDDAIARHPQTTFVLLHYASLEHDLSRLGAVLDRYPNTFIETGARKWTLGIKPHSGRKFALRYQDRLMFGTDAHPNRKLFESYFRHFETDDDVVEVDPTWGPVYGLSLPAEVLEKLYAGNARKLFRLQ